MFRGLCAGLLIAVLTTLAPAATVIFSDDFEGPYAFPYPEALSALDPSWTTGGLAQAASGPGYFGSGFAWADTGASGSAGVGEHPNGGQMRGNNHAIPGGPITSGVITYEADFFLRAGNPLQSLGSGQLGNLLISADNGPGFVPVANLQISGSAFQLEAGSLGGVGLPGHLPSTSVNFGAGSTGDEFHLALTFDLDNKTITASVTGDATATAGPFLYTNAFAPNNISFLAGPNGSNISGSTWDNISLSVIPEPSGLALLAVACGTLVRRRRSM